jgi:hypothetical protein
MAHRDEELLKNEIALKNIELKILQAERVLKGLQVERDYLLELPKTLKKFVEDTYVIERGSGPVDVKEFNKDFSDWSKHNPNMISYVDAWNGMIFVPGIVSHHKKEMYGISRKSDDTNILTPAS